MGDIDNSADVLDVREIIDRVEELREDRGDLEALQEAVDDAQGNVNDLPDDADEDDRTEAEDELAGARKDLQEAQRWAEENPDDAAELAELESLLDDLKGYGGDHQWQGDWYPVTLIRESYFEEYAEQFAEDIGAVPDDVKWPMNHIDWESAAEELKQDYSSTEFGGVTYYYLSA